LDKACREVEQRAAKNFERRLPSDSLLAIALDHLTLGRAALYRAILEHSPLSSRHSLLEAAVTGLRNAGQQDYLVRGLLTRAWYSFAKASEHRLHDDEANASNCLTKAKDDLDEAWEIAKRGSMKLFMADTLLYRARLFGGVKSEERRVKSKDEGGIVKDERAYPWASAKEDLAEARRLIEECGYWRRKEELEDAEKVAETWAQD